MDLKDGLVVCLFCLVLTTAYIFNSILILHDEVKRQSSTIDLLKTSRDNTVDELQQQKLKLNELDNTFLNFIDETSELQDIVVSIKHKLESSEHKIQSLKETDFELRDSLSSIINKAESTTLNLKAMERDKMHTETTILMMKTENMKQIQDLKETVTKLQSNYFNVKEGLVENKKHLIETFGNIFKETREVYRVIECIHGRLNNLEDSVNRRRDTTIISLIREGVSRLLQFGLNFFLGPVSGYIE
ncbi:Hypothetical predicted protein [Mytilus galloprovincialis]|uniref:Uncharacterized protein n=1 Tax=Mytilus galloprovincialis TaxID=29158 RepID=A0A8B6CAV1_MYTGA|nr:Hypothetical predicted protein [Mytilus galloprovincialis]